MLTKKNDNYEALELSEELRQAGIEINLDGICEDIETFLKTSKEDNK